MERGDLVALNNDAAWYTDDDGWYLWRGSSPNDGYGSSAAAASMTTGKLCSGDVAIVIKVTNDGVQLLTCRGEVGWSWETTLMVISR